MNPQRLHFNGYKLNEVGCLDSIFVFCLIVFSPSLALSQGVLYVVGRQSWVNLVRRGLCWARTSAVFMRLATCLATDSDALTQHA